MPITIDHIKIEECSTADEWNALSSTEQADLFAKSAVKAVGECKGVEGSDDNETKWRMMYLSAHDPKELQKELKKESENV